MTAMLARPRLALLAVPVAAALVAGCGSSGGSGASSTPATTASTAPAGSTVVAKNGRVTVTTTEYAFAPMAISAKPGKLRITLANNGKITHELVVLRTSKPAGSLTVGSGGRVSESSSVGEVSETAAGATKSSTLHLKAGTYVFVCNIPGHYADGMRGTLTVK
jgi:uncharacterized cupredoxin-like copper-binding protein